MTYKQFEHAKQELLDEMIASREHCPESIMAIRKCYSIDSLVATLNDFISQTRDKQFPSADFIRKHFANDIEKLNKLGIYIDQEGLEIDRNEPVWLFGHCTGVIKSDAIKFRDIIINDDSEVDIDAHTWALQRIWIKDHRADVRLHKAAKAVQIVHRKK